MMPTNDKVYRLIVRPRTHCGDMSWAVAFVVVRVHTQHMPIATNARAATETFAARPCTIPNTPNAVIVIGILRLRCPPRRPSCHVVVSVVGERTMAQPVVQAVLVLASVESHEHLGSVAAMADADRVDDQRDVVR